MKDIPTSKRSIEIYHERRVRKIKFLVFSFIIFIILFFSLAYLSSNKNIIITKVLVNNTKIINEEDVRRVISSFLNKKVFFFNQSNSFIYPKRKITESLKREFPRIENINLSLTDANTLEVNIEEKDGRYLYCGEVVPEDVNLLGENCYFVNDKGFIFDKAPYFSGNVYFKYYTSLASEGDPIGKQIFKDDMFTKYVDLISKINNLDFKTESLVVRPDGNATIYLVSNNLKKPEINFSTKDDFEDIYKNFFTATRKKEFIEEIKNKYDKLLYVDLRFKNKVLYKFDE